MVKKIAENFNRLSRAHQRHRQTTDRQTDGSAIAYSERERDFTSAKNFTKSWALQAVMHAHLKL